MKKHGWLKVLGSVVCFNLLLLYLWSPVSLATIIQQVPYPQVEVGLWVSDGSNTLTSETKAQINQAISNLHQQNESIILVAIVPKVEASPDQKDWLPSMPVEQFARDLFQHWHLNATRACQILLLISTSDRHIEILTNKAAAVHLPDYSLRSMIRNKFVPSMKDGDINHAILTVLPTLIQNIQYAPSPKQSRQTNGWIAIIPVVILLGLMGLALANPAIEEGSYSDSGASGGDTDGGGAGGDW